MKRLRKKLQSERGASILMALLMLLVCMMVASSIMAAAASNAGKIRSNRAEQQKYLVLSSAIRLVADEIEKAEYTGQYTVYEWAENIGTDEKPVWVSCWHAKQEKGKYSCGVVRAVGNPGELTDVLPLGKELDKIFSLQFAGTGYTPLPATDSSGNVLLESATPRILTVTVSGPPADTGPDVYTVFEKAAPADPSAPTGKAVVTVEVKLDPNTHHIRLTAWWGDGAAPADKSDTLIAELVAKVQKTDENGDPVEDADGNPVLANGNPLVVVSPPAGRMLYDSPPDDSAITPQGATSTLYWKLHWIKKGAAE